MWRKMMRHWLAGSTGSKWPSSVQSGGGLGVFVALTVVVVSSMADGRSEVVSAGSCDATRPAIENASAAMEPPEKRGAKRP